MQWFISNLLIQQFTSQWDRTKVAAGHIVMTPNMRLARDTVRLTLPVLMVWWNDSVHRMTDLRLIQLVIASFYFNEICTVILLYCHYHPWFSNKEFLKTFEVRNCFRWNFSNIQIILYSRRIIRNPCNK